MQVREPYANGPLAAWLQLTKPADRDEFGQEIAELMPIDDEIAEADPHAYLPSMALRMQRQAQEKILAKLQGDGLSGADLQAAFLIAFDSSSRASSIFAHEGRHALDRSDIPWRWLRSAADGEYRAKLSEVAFAPEPRIALVGGILSANIGDGSSHGSANERLMRGLVAWMDEHREAIGGLDPERPLLPQLDLLTDDQLRVAFRSMDPWAQ